ncbi:hypothetical protein Q3G72_027877 [Acer saccharum]|nr:hypothetical protein Q3G72_027877 [Acer saccharum]
MQWGLVGAWGTSKSFAVQCLDNCSSSRKEMHVDVSSLSGHLLDSLYSFSYLQQFSLSENYFSGQLSKELRRLTSPKYLIIFGNRLSGEFPNVFGNLKNLEFFIAHLNSFSGPLPLSLGLCSKLHELDLRNNSLLGSMILISLDFPAFICLILPGLEIVVLKVTSQFGWQAARSYKFLTCHGINWMSVLSIPPSTGLEFSPSMVLSNNMINRTIPPAVGQWKQLHVLDLSRNNISGTIPAPFQRCRTWNL